MEQPKPLFEQYIETIEAKQARINAKGMWKWIRPYLCQENLSAESLSSTQIRFALQAQLTPSFTTIRNRIGILKGFYNYCITENVRSDNPMSTISYKDVGYEESFRQFYWPNYLKILNTLNRLWTPDEGLPIYPVLVFAWVGVPFAKANSLSITDVQYEHQYIVSGDKHLALSGEMVDVLRRYADFTSSRRDNRMTMIRTYHADTFLYRLDIQNRTESESTKEPVNVSSVLSEASDILKEHHLCEQLKYNNIVKSGCLHRMYMMECEGHSFEEILQYGKAILKPPTAYPGDALLMYENFKKAFDLR